MRRKRKEKGTVLFFLYVYGTVEKIEPSPFSEAVKR